MVKSLCFIGSDRLHWRLNKKTSNCLKFKELLGWQIRKLVTKIGVLNYISVIDKGMDFDIADIILDLKRVYPITLECLILHKNQTVCRSDHDREHSFSILQQADRLTIIQSHFMEDRYRNRNRYMIDHSDYVYAVWDGVSDETGDIIHYAREKRRQIYFIDPVYSIIVPDPNNHRVKEELPIAF